MNKEIKVNLKTTIIFAIFIILLIGITILGNFVMNKIYNRKYLNNQPLRYDEEINEEQIANLVNITYEEFKEFKENFTGANVILEEEEEDSRTSFSPDSVFKPNNSKKIKSKEQAEENVKLLETYISNRDEYIYQFLLNSKKNSRYIESKLDSMYASVCSGMVKNYLKFDEYKLKIDEENGINQYINCRGTKFPVNEMMFSVNDKFLVVFAYSEDCFWINIYNGTKYNSNKESVIEERILGYNELIYWNEIDPETIMITDKPIIYLYPTEETIASVKLLNAEKITCSYPKYADEWNVLAKPNGDLIDLNTGRHLYSLYYESESIEKVNVSKKGFVVEGKDSAKFLEEKLADLGLTEREAEEFIIYWLPKLESNKYNYIRFANKEEIEKNMPLEISPKPDTIIRVLMIFKGLDNPIDIEQQKLETPERKGFTVVEWGGTEIKE